MKPSDLLRVLHEADPKHFAAAEAPEGEKAVALPLAADEFKDFRETTEEAHHPVTLNVQEAFMMYIKVSLVSGIVLASPWIFYQMWQFVAAGLYPHERRYVHVYLPMSIGLFLGGVTFCFFLALPLLLDFLLSYNRWLGVVPTIRLSEWVTFVILLPVMFGLSFQLPLVMLFLERIGIFTAADYRTRRRLAIFVMAVGSMIINPGGDVGSMALLFIPLVILYEFGILLCGYLEDPGSLRGSGDHVTAERRSTSGCWPSVGRRHLRRRPQPARAAQPDRLTEKLQAEAHAGFVLPLELTWMRGPLTRGADSIGPQIHPLAVRAEASGKESSS